MVELTRPVKRETRAQEFSRAELRNIIVSIEPTAKGASIGVRLKGTRDTFRIGVGSVYVMAVRLHNDAIEKEAKRLHKDERVPIRSARAKARKKLAKDLRWMQPDIDTKQHSWMKHPWFGTTTIQGLVARGVMEYTDWQQGRNGRFPIEVTIV